MTPQTKLNQSMSQRLVITPQVIISMRLLTLPVLELKTYLENQMIENPVLEIDAGVDLLTERLPESDSQTTDKSSGEQELDFKEQFDILTRMEEEWQENFFKNIAPVNDPDTERRRNYHISLITKTHSLYDHLVEQLALADLDPEGRIVAENIIGNIDENGYLQASLEEIAQACGAGVPKVRETLSIIQQFDPPGVGARDLKEALLIQLEYLGKNNTLAYQIIKEHFDDFKKKRFEKITRSLKVDLEKINQAKQLIFTLEPKPGRLFGEVKPQLISPDLILEKRDSEYVIILNNDEIPRLKINNYYKTLIKAGNLDPKTAAFIRDKIKSALWLVKGVERRQSTLLQIAQEMVNHQKEFLEKGRDYLKPLMLKDIARKVGMHQSTISRAITNKYIQTPQGLLAMKEFLNTRFKGKDGHYQVRVSIREKIMELIENEDPHQPLTDDDLVQLLSKEGIKIARRTVAKYRNAANILPSTLRKSS